jgi:hypothetical protein
MMPRRLLLPFFALALGCGSGSEDDLVGNAIARGWTTQTLPLESNETVVEVDLQVDSITGVAHALYAVNYGDGERLVYARGDGDGWSRQVVAGGRNLGNLALDREGMPHVAYIWEGPWDAPEKFVVKYARPVAEQGSQVGWAYEEVPLEIENHTGIEPYYLHLALDAGGHPHLGVIVGSDVVYAHDAGSGWTHEVVGVGVASSTIRIALDAKGAPRIAFIGDPWAQHGVAAPEHLQLATKGTDWNIRDLGQVRHGTTDPEPNRLDFAIAADGSEHFLYGNYATKTLQYAARANESWIVTKDIALLPSLWNARLTITGNTVHAVYNTLEGLAYARLESGEIVAQYALATAADMGVGDLFAIDAGPGGAPTVLFHTHADASLVLASGPR